ncbi:MAG: hypothetical protein KME09_21770 [Pleurocapsa minor HA4230-MV1]|nr:hypothetical protein [Pleurocapsa minor HA4230-MV1]
MNVNSSCPCCSSSMLLHLSSRRSFWLCSHCRAEIPNADSQVSLNKSTSIKFNSSGLKSAIAPLQSGQPVAAI